jgi:mannose-6-phosphate isomerase-like protein (cupin superfamily)
MKSGSRFSSVLSLALGAVSLTACQTAVDGVGLLAGPSLGEVTFSGYQPAEPYAQMAPGILTRKTYAAASGTGYRVEVQDLLVGPRQKTAEFTLGDASVFEVRSGNGLIVSADMKREIKAGMTFSLSDRKSFRVENSGDEPLNLRAHVFIAD